MVWDDGVFMRQAWLWRVAAGVLLGLVVWAGCQGQQAPAPAAKAPAFDPRVLAMQERLEDIGRGLAKFKADVGRYPEKLEELFASDAPGWKGPYVGTGPPSAPGAPSYGVQQQLTDSWGNRFKYVAGGEGPKVVCFGPDGKEGTADDLVVGPLAGP